MLWNKFYKTTIGCFFAVLLILALGTLAGKFLTANRNNPLTKNLQSTLAPEPWRLFTSQKGRFQVLFPGGAPTRKETTLGQNPQIKIFLFQVIRKNPISYTVSYYDLSFVPTNPNVLQNLSDKVVTNVDGKKLRSTKIKSGKVDGVENVIQMKLPRTNTFVSSRHRIFLKNQRVYRLTVVTPTEDAFKAETKKFMDSFQLIQ